MTKPRSKHVHFGFVMVLATITLIGFAAFRFLDAQDNTEVATTETQPTTSQVATIETTEDVETVTHELENLDAELDGLDSELDAEFAF